MDDVELKITLMRIDTISETIKNLEMLKSKCKAGNTDGFDSCIAELRKEKEFLDKYCEAIESAMVEESKLLAGLY